MVRGPSTTAVPALLLMGLDGTLAMTATMTTAAVWLGVSDISRLLDPGLFQRALVFAAVTVACLYYSDLYDLSHTLSARQITAHTLQALGGAALVLGIAAYTTPWLRLGPGAPPALLALALTLIGLLAFRLGLIGVSRTRDFQEKILILGTGPVARQVAKEILARPHLGLRIHGFIDDDPSLQGVSIVNPRVVGTTAEMPALVRREAIGRVVVALTEQRGRLPIDRLLDLKVGGTAVQDAASLYEMLTGKILVEQLRPSWLVFSQGFRPSLLNRATKRASGFLLAAIGLAIAGPLMLLVALLIRLDSAGPALFRQERVGRDERPFVLYKFRSMRSDAEAETGPVWAEAGDPRVTRVGRWLRKLRLDELPQLWNVLRGDMSFVGPRPERPHFVEQLKAHIPHYSRRHAVKPGVTGWAQVRYPYGNSIADALEKLQYDLYYVKNMSLALDLAIVLRTVKVVLVGRGAL